MGDNVGAAIIVRHVSWVSWKTDDARGRLAFDEIAGRPPDRRFTAPCDEQWSHHAEWYSGARKEAEEIGQRIRNHGGARVQVYDDLTQDHAPDDGCVISSRRNKA